MKPSGSGDGELQVVAALGVFMLITTWLLYALLRVLLPVDDVYSSVGVGVSTTCSYLTARGGILPVETCS